MRRVLLGVVFAGMLCAPAMAMQSGSQFSPGDVFFHQSYGQVKFVSPTYSACKRIPGKREFIFSTGWVDVLGNPNTPSAPLLADEVTDKVVANGLAFGAAWLVAWLKKEATMTYRSGYVELKPILVKLLSKGVWNSLNSIPSKLFMTGFVDNTWSSQEKKLVEAVGDLFVSKFTKKHEEETEKSIDELIKSLQLEGLYIDPKRISKVLGDAKDNWDVASGISSGTTGTKKNNTSTNRTNTNTTISNNVTLTQFERNLIRTVLGRSFFKHDREKYQN